jgi:hypothetical protein
MTDDHDRKRLVRSRMSKTGESYAAASRHLRWPSREPSGTSWLFVGSDELQEAVEHARRIAAGDGASEVEPKHVLIGLSSVRAAGAAQVMSAAGLTADSLSAALGVALRESEGGSVRFSVAAKSAVEFARAHAWEGTAADRRRQGAVQPTEGPPLWPRPLRTADVLLGLLDEGSVAQAMSALVDLGELVHNLQELRNTDIERPPPWSGMPRYARMSQRVRTLLACLDASPGTEAQLCSASFHEIDDMLRSLPPHRQAGTAALIWEVTKGRLRSELSKAPLKRLATLDEDALCARSRQLVEEDPTVIRARRYFASTH